tara:strand:- start:4439 stop:5119 length:681 start_codon:yes stop_codon:yes gene_type:complete
MTAETIASVPEEILVTILKSGVEAVSADLSILGEILTNLHPNDLQQAKDYWEEHPPNVVSGYARGDSAWPVIAVTLTGEQIQQDYIGLGEEALFIGDGDDKVGRRYKRRLTGQYGIHIYTEHPSVCAWYYRVIRRFLNVGIETMIRRGMQDPVMAGQDLAPDPRFVPENVFVRRLTITVEYEEAWESTSGLAEALLENSERYLAAAGELNIHHEDAGGDVIPYVPD